MKVIIIEGTDNTGKDTLISKIMEKYETMTVIHCGKPKSKTNPSEEQDNLFNFYADSIIDHKYDNTDVIIMNRSHIGEYVYGVLYRHRDPNEVLKMILDVDTKLIKANNVTVKYVQLECTSDKLLNRNEDGKSLSQGKAERIHKETELFTEAYVKSFLQKKLVYVNDGDNFRSREDIFNEVWEFITRT